MNTEQLLETLNNEQKKAVEINKGSLLVFAGAGSGKTRVITSKIVYAILENLYKPYEILAVTFTNKACNEMSQRVRNMIDLEESQSIMIKTFHSFGVWLLKRFPEKIGLKKNFTIYDEDDCKTVMAKCFPDYPKKDMDIMTKRVLYLKEIMERPSSEDEELSKCYYAYQNALEKSSSIDFPDMILKSIQLLKENEDVREYIQNRFKMILVDEYQDSNTAQFILLKLICSDSTFLCVVGDDDQSIYKFRGANVNNIINFANNFSNTETVILNTNYRCTQAILDVANDVISNNKIRVQKNLTANKKNGTKPILFEVDSEEEESRKICSIIKTFSPDDINETAVIYRTNAQSRSFEQRFLMEGIPYVLVGSLRFYEREEVKDGIALLKLLVNPNDVVSFTRMVNKPSRGLGETSVQKILDIGGDLIEASKKLLIDGVIKGKAKEGLQHFCGSYENAKNMIGKVPNSELLYSMLSEFGLVTYYSLRDAKSDSSTEERSENLSSLVNNLSADDYVEGLDGLLNFLENTSLDASSLGISKKDTGVTLITMHNTKGLEFKNVFVVGLENEIFPGNKTLNSGVLSDIEEERRICYVAFTRAKDKLYLSYSRTRYVWGAINYQNPSMFLSEIKKEHLDIPYIRKRTNIIYKNFSRPILSNAVHTSVNEDKRSESKYKVKDRVFSDILGEGVVTKITNLAGREIMMVLFDNGKMATYLLKSANLTKLGD